MKKMIFALLATGLMGSALAQSTPPADSSQATTSQQTPVRCAPGTTQQSQGAAGVPCVPGAKTATTQSLGDMVPFAVVGGVIVVGAIVAATSGGGKTASPAPTGTTP